MSLKILIIFIGKLNITAVYIISKNRLKNVAHKKLNSATDENLEKFYSATDEKLEKYSLNRLSLRMTFVGKCLFLPTPELEIPLRITITRTTAHPSETRQGATYRVGTFAGLKSL